MGIFIFLPRIVMNNTTTYSVNAANTANSQSEKSSKWAKVGKIATGIALAGALTMGVAKYVKNSSETNSNNNWEVKTEVVVTPDNQDSELSDIDFDKAAAELNYEFRDMQIKADSISNLEDAKRIAEEGNQIREEAKRIAEERNQIREDSKRIAEERNQIREDSKRIAEEGRQISEEGRQIREKREQTRRDVEKELAGVTKEMLEGSQKLQKIVIRHIEQGKKYWYQPSQHTLDLMISINK